MQAWLKEWFFWLCNELFTLGATMLSALWAQLPFSETPTGEALETAVKIANNYVPLDYGVTLFLAYCTWCGVWISYRRIKALFPTWGES